MNILEQIQNAEQEAANRKRLAQADAREFLFVCERKAQEVTAQKISAAEEKAIVNQNQAVLSAEEKARRFLDESTQKDDVLIEKAQGRLSKAVSYIIHLAEELT